MPSDAESPLSKLPLLKNLWAKEAAANSVPRPQCHCLDPQSASWTRFLELHDEAVRDGGGEEPDIDEDGISWSELSLHTERQDTTAPGWARLVELIDQAARDSREEFSPVREMPPEQWAQITELPASIAKLKSVKHLILYGSSLVRIPPEIGEMSSLEQFTPYTSYRLHWFPFEISRCAKLKESTVSTRALYGNFKFRAPFPKLPQLHEANVPPKCSVCNAPFGDATPLQYWISSLIGSDVLPLLVHACSERCLSRLPKPPDGYVQFPHQGGLQLCQPSPFDD